VYMSNGNKSINMILLSHIILFLFLLIFLVVLVVFGALSRRASGLTLRDKVHNFTRTGASKCIIMWRLYIQYFNILMIENIKQ
jgi:hypothetical protein